MALWSSMYYAHRGKYMLESVGGNPSILLQSDIETIDAVLEYYGEKSSQWLSDLTHQEHPWQKTRDPLPRGQRGSEEMTRIFE